MTQEEQLICFHRDYRLFQEIKTYVWVNIEKMKLKYGEISPIDMIEGEFLERYGKPN